MLISEINHQGLVGIELMPHPKDIPDLAPLDYNLFRCMAYLLLSKCFHNQEASREEFFASKDMNWCEIEELAKR